MSDTKATKADIEDMINKHHLLIEHYGLKIARFGKNLQRLNEIMIEINKSEDGIFCFATELAKLNGVFVNDYEV